MCIHTISRAATDLCFSQRIVIRLALNEIKLYRVNGLGDKAWGKEKGRAYFYYFYFEEFEA